MITILYNQDDYEAASIAMRVQSLAQSAASKIYIVPKHYGRIESTVYANLSKTQYAIFLAHDVLSTDKQTINDINELKKRSVPIQYVVPQGYHIDKKLIATTDLVSYFHSGNQNKIISDLASTISKLSNQAFPKKQPRANASSNNDAVAIGIIAGLALLLLALATTENKTSRI